MKIIKFPELRQTYSWDCGANAIQSVLVYYGMDIREEVIIKIAGTNGRTGTPIHGMKKSIKKYNLDFKAGKMKVDNIKEYIDQDVPVLVLVQAWSRKKDVNWEKDWSDGHCVVVIGYDSKKIYFEDPSSVVRTYLTYEEFEMRWHDADVGGKKYINWGMAVFGKRKNYLEIVEHMN